ncbi:MAG: acetyl-CoA carboxylase carboxyl transferase subunit alpha, partial [Cyclobacteriaceae bacterium]|nr:acetyl-CoA carboxylase carboxyl transferase subunit alpha [Cyclobacteriaceae bacterium]
MLLDFEKPIVELDEKIADMKSLAEQSGVDVSDAIKALEEKLQKLKKETYSNLTRWQRVQLSRHQDRPYTLDYIYELTDDF